MVKENIIDAVISELHKDSENDFIRVVKGMTKSVFRPMQPRDMKNAYLAISYEQGLHLVDIIKSQNLRDVVEFGTSFGISTLYLAKGVMQTGGKIITTELIESKAERAKENFEKAGVSDLIEIRVGDALETLKDHNETVDLLLLDGWKDLYLDVFQLLEPNFHANTIIYVDNADMSDTKLFLQTITQNETYRLQEIHHGKAVLITTKNR